MQILLQSAAVSSEIERSFFQNKESLRFLFFNVILFGLCYRYLSSTGRQKERNTCLITNRASKGCVENESSWSTDFSPATG